MGKATSFPVVIVVITVFVDSRGAQPFFVGDDCYNPLGMSDRRINDSAIRALAWYNNDSSLYGPSQARLNHPGGYRADPNSQTNRILEVYFSGAWIITGIATQGYYGDNIQEWTEQYTLGYRFNNNAYFFEDGDTTNAEVFIGNQDNNSIVFHNVSRPAKVNAVIVYPIRWHNNFAIRMELYGCQADGNECLSSPCQNNGTCLDMRRSYVCNCARGFNGTNCELNIDDCWNNPCVNGGSCVDLINDFACICTPGYTGKNCSQEIDECQSNPCNNSGTCIDLLDGYYCNCTLGYNGTRCELANLNLVGWSGDIDDCYSNPCQNNGTCQDIVNDYNCSCPSGFAGKQCGSETGFFLVAWFKLRNMVFTFTLLNKSSALYKSTESNVISEVAIFVITVDSMLRQEDTHYFGSALKQFSPTKRDSVIAVVSLRTISNSTGYIANVLIQKMKNQTGTFESDTDYKSFENRAIPGCPPPNITLPLSKDSLQATKIRKSEDFTFVISAQIDCLPVGQAGKVQVLYTVTPYEIDLTSGSFRRVVTSIGTLVGSIDWTIRKQELDYGVYYFKMEANIEKQIGTTIGTFGFFEVSSTELVARIFGRAEISHGFNHTLTLNGSQSYDPDLGLGNYIGLDFTWLCKRRNEEFPDDVTSLPVVKPSPGLSDSLGGCYGTGVGKLQSKDGTPYLVDLAVDSMEGGEDYVIKLLLTKRGQTATAIHSLRINDAIQLSIECIQNCRRPVSLSSRLILETRCTGLLCRSIESYVWSVEYQNFTSNTWKHVADLDDLVLTYANAPNFVTKEGILIANASYVIAVNGTTSGGISSVTNYTFITNTAPMGGSCTVDRTEGKAWETDFIFTCYGWRDSDLPLRYKFRYKSEDGIMMVFQSGTSSKAIGKLPVGNEHEDYTLRVQVQIVDALDSVAEVWIIVRVTEPVVSSDNLLQAVSEDGLINGYLKNNNIELAAQSATAVLSVVNHADASEVETADKIKIRDSIIESLSTFNASKLEDVSQVSAVVASAAEKRDELSIESQGKAVGILDSMTAFMASQVMNKTYNDEEELVEHVGTALLNGMGNLLSITSYEASGQDGAEELGPVVTDNERKEKGRSNSKQILRLINEVGNNVKYSKELHEKPSVLQTQTISMLIDRQVPARIGDKVLENEGSKVAVPPARELIGSGVEKQHNLSSHLVTFKENPFTWDDSARKVKSVVLDFELKDQHGDKLNLSNLTQEFELFIPLLKTQAPDTTEPGNFFVKPYDNGTLQFHKIDIPGPEYSVFINITPIADKNLSVLVRYAKRPTFEEYNFTASVPDYSTCQNHTEGVGFFNCSTDPYVVTISAAKTGHTGRHYVAVVYREPGDEEKGNHTILDSRPRVRRDCSQGRRQKRSCVGVKEPPTTPPPIRIIKPSFNASTDVNYTMSVSIATCLYWDVDEERWTTEGCRVGPNSRPEALQCLCTHLSSFGGDIFVAPNPIDFDYVFTQFPNIFESGNVVVLATVISIFALYIIGLIIARRADRKDERKAVENLCLPAESEHLYEVSVYTGMWKDCGTSANVAMIIYGEETRSETLHLFDSYTEKKLFARASITNFIVTLPDSFYSPVMIKLWHDNTGTNPSWYVNQVVIRDVETDEKWYFLCNRWLAVDKEDGELEVDIPLATKNQLASFKYQFYTRLSRNLGDGHIWLSVVTRPPHSPFTRAQRISCCVCVLLCAMLAGAMFYQFGEEQDDTIKFGPLRFSVRQLVIGVQSALIVVPLNVLIVAIFRNVKTPSDVRKSQYQHKERHEDENSNSAKKVKSPGFLPHFFVYIAWALCILASLTAGTFIIFYSVQWGKELSNQWLTSALISLVQDIAVMQPIKVILFAVILALILKKPPEEKTAQSVNNSDLAINKNMKVVAPKGNELLEARQHRESVVGTIGALVEIVLFVLFVIFLFIIVYGNRGTSRYRLTAVLENIFKESFEEIDSREAFWDWIKEEFVPGLYETQWYNDRQFIGPEGYVSTREAFLVGMPRVRQVRVKEEYPCEVASAYSSFKTMFKRCIPFYSPDVEDTTRYYLPGWIPVTNISLYDSLYDLLRLCPKPWRYNTSGELDTLSFEGIRTVYEGGGYVADLGYNFPSAMGVILNLESNSWVDEKTAAIFVEFTVFEPSSSLFSTAKFLYGVLPTGRPETRARFDTLSIYTISNPSLRTFFIACQIMLFLLIVYYFFVEMARIYRQGCLFFSSFWNWMDLLQVIFAIVTIAFFFLKEKYVSSFVRHVQANPFETASTDYIVFWSELELIMLSVIVFIVTVKFLRIIRFNKHVCQMIASIKLSSSRMASYSVLFFIDLVSFALLGVLVFGNDLEAYHTFTEALSSLFQKFLGGDLYFYELQSVNRILGPTYVFFYMLSMGFILINMFVAILNDSYESVKELSGGKFADAELGIFMKDYYMARLVRLFEVIKRKLGNVGFRHKFYDRPTTESKLKLREEHLGSFLSLPSEFPPYVPFSELRDRVDYSSQLGLLDNEIPVGETGANSDNSELTPSTADETDSASAPSVDSNTTSSNVELLDLLGDLPESMVDDDETIANVRKDLAEAGAVLRLSKRTYRRFSRTGDKYVVQTDVQIGPSVAITFRPRKDSKNR